MIATVVYLMTYSIIQLLAIIMFNIIMFSCNPILLLRDVNLKYNFVETPRKFAMAELSIRKLGSSSVLIVMMNTDEDPSLWIESSAIINLRGVSTKLYFNLIFTMQTYKELR